MKMCVNGLNDVKGYSMKNAISFRIPGKLKKEKKFDSKKCELS